MLHAAVAPSMTRRMQFSGIRDKARIFEPLLFDNVRFLIRQADTVAVHKPSRLFFLPGALGRTKFWHPVAGLPTLLLWGDADPISPVKVGQRLAALLPRAELHVCPGGGHDVGYAFAGAIAPLIDRHLSS